ncbi:MAG: hypothetical protein F9K45_12035 [Melioribacteraceae bacterium]|nr:MAG: hypothetical protein F9K45_12035 [Melioribacteraceae bacterium]
MQRTPNSWYGVYGTAENDVWVVGSKVDYNPSPPPPLNETSFIIHYDGSKWVEHKVNTSSAVYNVYAIKPNDVWACGADGIVYHYNGSHWDIDTIKISKSADDFFQLNNMIKHNEKLYCLGRNATEQGAKLTYYFFENINNDWIKLDSFIIEGDNLEYKWGPAAFYVSKINKLYSHGFGGVFEYSGSEWINIFKTEYAITDMKGEENNFVLSGDFGHVFHYNGKDWKELTNLYREEVVYSGVWIDKDEVFVIGWDLSGYPQTTLVWHGK